MTEATGSDRQVGATGGAGANAVRTAACRCGQLRLTCTGEPVRVSVCHCLDCQRRSGSAFAVQARFAPEQVEVAGTARYWQQTIDDQDAASFHFCPDCGTQMWYHARPHRALYAIPVGTFADPHFPPPEYSVYEGRKHAWLAITGDGIEHYE